MGDQVEETCPLCAEEMDSTDRQLKPCKCGYELCVWCWHHIMDMAEKDETEGRCPACRTPYDKEKIVGMTSNSGRFVTDNRIDKKMKAQKVKIKAYEGRKQFGSVRVVQRNLAYVVGIPAALANQDILQRKEYFGQYGRILKISISRTSSTSIHHVPNSTCSVYVTFTKEDEAISCIEAADGFILDGKSLRACFGTTKYCHTWLRNVPCSNPDCLYLHEVGAKEDSFTKDVIVTAYTRFQNNTRAANILQLCSGSTLPPPTNKCSSDRSLSNAKPMAEYGNVVGEGSPPDDCSNKSAALPPRAVLSIPTAHGQFSNSVGHTKHKTLSSTAMSTTHRSRPCENIVKRPMSSKQKQTEQQFQSKPEIDLSTNIRDRQPRLDAVDASDGASASTDGSGTLQNSVRDKILKNSFDRNGNPSDTAESVSFSNDEGYKFMKSDEYTGIHQSRSQEVAYLPFDDHLLTIQSKEHHQNMLECSIDHREPVLSPSLPAKLDILRVSSMDPGSRSGFVNDTYNETIDGSCKSYSYQRSSSSEAMSCSGSIHSFYPSNPEFRNTNPEILHEHKPTDFLSNPVVNAEKTDICSKNYIESSIISNILSMDFDTVDDSLTPPHDLLKFFCKNDIQEGPIQTSSSLKVNGMNQSRFYFARDDGESSGVHNFVKEQPVFQSYAGCRGARIDALVSVGINESDISIEGDHILPSTNHFAARPFISPPPGFSTVQVPIGAPPPGFLNRDSAATTATCHIEDITLLDPAILAVGKGVLPIGADFQGSDPSQTDPMLGILLSRQQRQLSFRREGFNQHPYDPPARPIPWVRRDIPALNRPRRGHHWDGRAAGGAAPGNVPARPQRP